MYNCDEIDKITQCIFYYFFCIKYTIDENIHINRYIFLRIKNYFKNSFHFDV